MVMAVSVYGERHITSEELAAAAHTLLSSLFLLVCLQSGLPAAVHWELSCQDWQWPPCCPTHDNALHQLLDFSALVSPSGLSPHFVFVSFLSFFFLSFFVLFGLTLFGVLRDYVRSLLGPTRFSRARGMLNSKLKGSSVSWKIAHNHRLWGTQGFRFIINIICTNSSSYIHSLINTCVCIVYVQIPTLIYIINKCM